MGMFAFSRREVKDILISVLVLSFVFAYPEIIYQPAFFLFSLLTVGIAFMGHELSHRFVARRRGFFSEYRMWPQGLLFALILAFASNGSFIFAAPGAVIFSSYWVFRQPGLEDIGKIGIAGVVFNITLLYIFTLSYLLTGISVLAFAGLINGWLAIFNLIPFGPLDGRKVMRWNWKAWLTAIILAIIGFVILSVF
jgi:Zn-dependent protease